MRCSHDKKLKGEFSLGIECVSTLSQYIGDIEQLRSFYPTGPLANNPAACPFIYRGICDAKYELLPSVFRKQADIIGDQRIPNYTYQSWTSEKSLLLSFIHEAIRYIQSISPTEFGTWAEYAQHYGVPTRFLDFTNNPLTALYFSCKDNTSTDGAVWLLHAINYEKFLGKTVTIPNGKRIRDIISELINHESDVEYPIIYTPYYADPRMSAQGSYFMVWGKSESSLTNILKDDSYYMNYPKINNDVIIYGEEQEKAVLFKFLIHANQKQSLLHELDIVGINEKTLFPGLDGIGRYIERKYRFDYNEAARFG